MHRPRLGLAGFTAIAAAMLASVNQKNIRSTFGYLRGRNPKSTVAGASKYTRHQGARECLRRRIGGFAGKNVDGK